jgi:hypothetical protein
MRAPAIRARPLRLGVMGPKNPLRVNFDLRRDFNVIWVVQSPFAKIFRFPFTPNQWLLSRRPDPRRGRIASRHETRDGMWWTRGRRRARQSQGEIKLVSGSRRETSDVSAFAKASADLHLSPAKPLGEDGSRVRQNGVVLTPVAGAKSAEACRPNRAQASHQSADDGDKTNSLAGESTA